MIHKWESNPRLLLQPYMTCLESQRGCSDTTAHISSSSVSIKLIFRLPEKYNLYCTPIKIDGFVFAVLLQSRIPVGDAFKRNKDEQPNPQVKSLSICVF